MLTNFGRTVLFRKRLRDKAREEFDLYVETAKLKLRPRFPDTHKRYEFAIRYYFGRLKKSLKNLERMELLWVKTILEIREVKESCRWTYSPIWTVNPTWVSTYNSKLLKKRLSCFPK